MMKSLAPPTKKSPLRRTQEPTLPPKARNRRSHDYTRIAAEGRFALQRCDACGAYAYPARDACPTCLSSRLSMHDAPNGGILLSETTARVPADVYFRERGPWRIGIVGMDCGPRIVAHLHSECRTGERVHMSFKLDKGGNAAAFAIPTAPTANMADDPQWREMTSDPKFRRALITNGRSSVGQEIAAALAEAGTSTVYVGICEAWKPYPGEERLRAMPNVKVVPLDLSDERSVMNLASDIGSKTDILVHTAEHVRPGGLVGRHGSALLREDIEQNHFGLLHLAQSFGPAMLHRGADGLSSATAWVNILSVYALCNWPAYGVHSASQAAAYSLSQCLRAELRMGGVRVTNLFVGPLETEWYQTVPPPKVAPRVVAAAVVASLRNGTEDVFVGDVAEEVRRRLVSNPKALERELGE